MSPHPIDPRRAAIQHALEQTFAPEQLAVDDEGDLHQGHAGAGGGHFSVQIVAAAFANKTALERHRMVYKALADIPVHALRIQALSPDEL